MITVVAFLSGFWQLLNFWKPIPEVQPTPRVVKEGPAYIGAYLLAQELLKSPSGSVTVATEDLIPGLRESPGTEVGNVLNQPVIALWNEDRESITLWIKGR